MTDQTCRELTVAEPRSRSALRIAFVGRLGTAASATITRTDPLPQGVCRRLRATYPLRALEAGNFASPGCHTRQLAESLPGVLATFVPHVVVIWVNDMNGDTADAAKGSGFYGGVPFAPSGWARRVARLRWIEQQATIVLRLIRAQSSRGKLRIVPAELTAAFEGRLTRIVQQCSEHGALVVLLTPASRVRRTQSRIGRARACASSVLYMPYLSINGMLDAWQAYDDAIRRVAQATGALLIDTTATVPGDRRDFVDSSHLSAQGIRRLAEGVGDALCGDKSFRAIVAAV